MFLLLLLLSDPLILTVVVWDGYCGSRACLDLEAVAEWSEASLRSPKHCGVGQTCAPNIRRRYVASPISWYLTCVSSRLGHLRYICLPLLSGFRVLQCLLYRSGASMVNPVLSSPLYIYMHVAADLCRGYARCMGFTELGWKDTKSRDWCPIHEQRDAINMTKSCAPSLKICTSLRKCQ